MRQRRFQNRASRPLMRTAPVILTLAVITLPESGKRSARAGERFWRTFDVQPTSTRLLAPAALAVFVYLVVHFALMVKRTVGRLR